METELFTLRESNAKLVAALREANSSIEQWKNQLSEYQKETHRLRDQASCFVVFYFILFAADFSWSSVANKLTGLSYCSRYLV